MNRKGEKRPDPATAPVGPAVSADGNGEPAGVPAPSGGETGRSEPMELPGTAKPLAGPAPSPGSPAESPAKTDSGDEAASLAAAYLDQLQRLQAEFDNYRRRVRREQEDWFRQAKAELVERFLPVLDDLRRAREHAGPEGPPDAAGLQLILRRFEDALNKAGLEEQKAEPGAAFDPEQHEALLVVPSEELPEGAIVQVIEPGYLFQGRLIRRGKVACSSGSQPE